MVNGLPTAKSKLVLVLFFVAAILLWSGIPRKQRAKPNLDFPESIQKIDQISAGPAQTFSIPIPDGYADYQIFLGSKLENIKLKTEAARKFTNLAGDQIKSTTKVKVFESKIKNNEALYLIKSSGELFYKKDKNSKQQLLGIFNEQYFEEPELLAHLARSNVAKVSDDQNFLSLNYDQLEKLKLASDRLTVVFYKKDSKRPFKKAYPTATEIVRAGSQEDQTEAGLKSASTEKETTQSGTIKRLASIFSWGSSSSSSQSEPSNTTLSSQGSSSSDYGSSHSSAGCDVFASGGGAEGDEASVALAGDGNSKITSVSISNEKPKNSDWKNANNSLGSFSWKYKIDSDGQAATATSKKGFKWFGVGNGDDLCTETIFSGSQAGIYQADLSVTFANGCRVKKQIEIDIDYPGFGGSAVGGVFLGGAFEISTVSGYPKKSGLGWECCVNVACPAGNCINATGEVTEWHEKGLQYETLANKEEEYHARQTRGEVDWANGGLSKNGVKISDAGTYISKYNLGTVCKTGFREGSVCTKAHLEAQKRITKVGKSFVKDIAKWAAKIRCYREKTVKQVIGLLKNKAGMHYECAYVKPGACSQEPSEQRYFWEYIGK